MRGEGVVPCQVVELSSGRKVDILYPGTDIGQKEAVRLREKGEDSLDGIPDGTLEKRPFPRPKQLFKRCPIDPLPHASSSAGAEAGCI